VTELDYFATPWITGYGEAARRNLRGLEKAGAKVRWVLTEGDGHGGNFVIEWPLERIGDPGHLTLTPAPAPADTRPTIVHDLVEAHATLIDHVHPRGVHAWYTVWEAEHLHHSWVPVLNQVDRVIVPCRWNAEVFESSGVTRPVEVVAHPVTEVEPAPPPVELPADVFVFYSVTTWTYRKRVDLLLDAFCAEFGPDEPVLLFLKTPELMDFSEHTGTRRLVRNELAIQLARRGRVPSIALDTGYWSDAQVAGLHRRGDCYVTLPHGEAWGLGAFDAAAADRPVIITGYGGPLDYLGADYPGLVDFELAQVQAPATMPTLDPDNRWAHPSVEHARELMRSVYQDREAANETAARVGDSIRSRFSQQAIGQGLIDAVS
jgi:glycosyltransferase involved in cell wall biosynthesis